jgi:nucleoside-diphosphate-sugar epimerase
MHILITGATGMVGEGVLHEAVLDNRIEKIYVLGRKSCLYVHTKIEEIISSDFFALTSYMLSGKKIDACLFCAGVSSVGKSNDEYYKLTYEVTLHVAQILFTLYPLATFCYISGAGTNSQGVGKSNWANTKGKTENDLLKLGFKAVYNFRPGILMPTNGLKNTLAYYDYFGWLGKIINTLAPNIISTLAQLGKAMINASVLGYEKTTLEVKDIKQLASKVK